MQYTLCSEIQDNTISEHEPTTNYGSTNLMMLTTYTGWGRKILLKVPLANLPTFGIIDATLYLYYYQYNTTDPVAKGVNAIKISRHDWSESQSNWNEYKTGSNWSAAGTGTGDVDASITSTGFVPASYGWMTWDIKTHIEDAVANSVDLDIRLKKNTSEALDIVFRSSEYSDAAYRPYILINCKSYNKDIMKSKLFGIGV